MGRGGEGDFEERERRGARNAEMGTREGIGRVVYLGGLGEHPRPSTYAVVSERPRSSPSSDRR